MAGHRALATLCLAVMASEMELMFELMSGEAELGQQDQKCRGLPKA